jgi:hypothetical protein
LSSSLLFLFLLCGLLPRFKRSVAQLIEAHSKEVAYLRETHAKEAAELRQAVACASFDAKELAELRETAAHISGGIVPTGSSVDKYPSAASTQVAQLPETVLHVSSGTVPTDETHFHCSSPLFSQHASNIYDPGLGAVGPPPAPHGMARLYPV